MAAILFILMLLLFVVGIVHIQNILSYKEKKILMDSLHTVCGTDTQRYFLDKLAVLGAHYSGMDICFDLYKYAEKIYLCHNNDPLGANLPDNVLEKTSGFSKTQRSVTLDNGEELFIDSVIYCTGYKYNFPYLPDGIVEVGKDNLINNLYKYIIPAEYTNLFFMGILRQVLLFPLADHQALFIRAVLEGSAKLPEKVEMFKIIAEDSKRTIDERNQQEWNKEISEIAGNFETLPPVLYNIRNHHFGMYWKDLPKSKSVCYQVENVEIDKENPDRATNNLNRLKQF